MTNKELIEKRLNNTGYTLGCWNKQIEKVSKKEMFKVVEAINNLWSDVIVTIRKETYVIEIATVDNEIDFSILSKAEYIETYGNEKFENEED